MDEPEFTPRQTKQTLGSARRRARARGQGVSDWPRDALETSDEFSEGTLSPKRRLHTWVEAACADITGDLEHARSWSELQGRLYLKGFAFKVDRGSIALHHHPNGIRICGVADLGTTYLALVRKFGAPFPGHAHRWLAKRLLSAPLPKREDAAPASGRQRRSA